MPLSNSYQRAEAEEILALGYGHDDVSEFEDYHIFAWMEELGWEWNGDAWQRDDVEPEPKPSKPRKTRTTRKSEAEKLAAWNNMTAKGE